MLKLVSGRMLRTLMIICLAAWAVLAQDPAALFEKAPPDVDEALRARVKEFYQFHVEGKFRAADALVAEESKDAFFGMDKPHCREFAIGTVRYSDSFTRAQVMISCDTDMFMPMMGRFPVKRPITSKWKVEDSRWFWYVDPPGPPGESVTPFGVSKPQQAEGSAAPTGLSAKFVDMGTVTSGVKADKSELVLDPGSAASAEVTFTNQLPGSVSLALEGRAVKGLTFKLDRTALAGGERAVLSIRYEPVEGQSPSPATVQVVVSPTDQVIPVSVGFASVGPGRAN